MGQVAFGCFGVADQALHFQVPLASWHEIKKTLMAFFPFTNNAAYDVAGDSGVSPLSSFLRE
jgi:hypothetical protein